MELSLDRLTKQYGRKIAVDCVSATLKPGVYGLLGANGAGKTTLMRMLCAVLESTSGEVLLDGKEVTSMGADYRNVLFTTGFWILSKLYCGGVLNVYCSTERNTEEGCKKTCD